MRIPGSAHGRPAPAVHAAQDALYQIEARRIGDRVGEKPGPRGIALQLDLIRPFAVIDAQRRHQLCIEALEERAVDGEELVLHQRALLTPP